MKKNKAKENAPDKVKIPGLFWLTQDVERNSVVRKLQILKLRGLESVPGLHTIRIDHKGLQAFSRTLGLVWRQAKPAKPRRLSIGIPELDKMMGGGIREGDSVLVSGPSGTGKSALATQFLAAGLRDGEPESRRSLRSARKVTWRAHALLA
jgi:circadian clock protein KaiC